MSVRSFAPRHRHSVDKPSSRRGTTGLRRVIERHLYFCLGFFFLWAKVEGGTVETPEKPFPHLAPNMGRITRGPQTGIHWSQETGTPRPAPRRLLNLLEHDPPTAWYVSSFRGSLPPRPARCSGLGSGKAICFRQVAGPRRLMRPLRAGLTQRRPRPVSFRSRNREPRERDGGHGRLPKCRLRRGVRWRFSDTDCRQASSPAEMCLLVIIPAETSAHWFSTGARPGETGLRRTHASPRLPKAGATSSPLWLLGP